MLVNDEIDFLKAGGNGSIDGREEIGKLFVGQRETELGKMQEEVEKKIGDFNASGGAEGNGADVDYWKKVLQRLKIHRCEVELRRVHKQMLKKQLELLEERREEMELRGEKREKVVEDANDGKKEGGRKTQYNSDSDDSDGDLGDEIGLTADASTENKKYNWDDKYKPRKPRYFNRVKTGYDWNQYNKTHYDHDNPPPTVVQGSTFNVFYPDLIDVTKTPQFFLEPADSDEFAIIRFHGGPPYEDIAFKILNKEWARQRKKGYKCTFERGILTLFFNFNSHWYRR